MSEEEAIYRLALELRTAEPVRMQMPALQALSVLSIVQFAWRNAVLDRQQKALIGGFGRVLQEAIAARAPGADETLERGWDTIHVPPPGTLARAISHDGSPLGDVFVEESDPVGDVVGPWWSGTVVGTGEKLLRLRVCHYAGPSEPEAPDPSENKG